MTVYANLGVPPEAAAPVEPSVPRPLRFAALGDSLTAGVGDRVEGGWRGWAVLLAEALVPADGDGDRTGHGAARRGDDGTAALGGPAQAVPHGAAGEPPGRADRAAAAGRRQGRPAAPARRPGALSGALPGSG
ncbi:hypothetical protein P3L51_35655, partial [Streptomyces sp. PSRA5]